MSASELCDLLIAQFTSPEFSFDGLTGEGMTWDETGAVSKSPKGMVIANGADPLCLYDIVEGKPVGTRFLGNAQA